MTIDSAAMARQIAERIAEKGGRVWFVGGCVRDGLLGRKSKDLDLEVHGTTPETLLAVLEELGEPIAMGASFGIYGLKGYDLDLSLPRAENRGGKQDIGSHVDPFIGEEAAARRRDFTVNAMMQDVLTGEIVDYFGGAADLQAGVLRHVEETTFAEDPLRVFRAAQFAARFGFSVAEETMTLCSRLDVSRLPGERVFAELQKVLLQAQKPSVFFQILREMGQLMPWFAEVQALIGVEQDKRHHPEGDVWNHTMAVLDAAAALRQKAAFPLYLMLSALCHDFGKPFATQIEGDRIRALGHEEAGLAPAETFLRRMTGEVKLQRYVQNMVLLHMRPNLLAAQKSGAKATCSLFDRSVCPEDLLLLARADYFGKGNACEYEQTERFLHEALTLFHHRMAQPCVTGADLVQAGFSPGEHFGAALAFAHKLRLAGVEKASALKQTAAYLRSVEKNR